MLIVIDIGNTTVEFAVMAGKKIHKKFQLAQPLKQVALTRCIKTIKKKYPKVNDAIICSVVPEALRKITQVVKKEFKFNPKIVGKDIKIPINNNYRNPKQVGQDRLVCAYAAKIKYGSPLIVIDLGTAITFEVISSKGEYEGGMIIPGIKLTLDSLHQNTALLPKVNRIKIPKGLIGKSTEESILSGIFFGYGQMICGLIDKVSYEIGVKPKVVITGGYANLMKKFIKCKINIVENNLVFLGMAELVNNTVESS